MQKTPAKSTCIAAAVTTEMIPLQTRPALTEHYFQGVMLCLYREFHDSVGSLLSQWISVRHDPVAWPMWFTHTLGIQAAIADTVMAHSNTDDSRLTSDDPDAKAAD